MPRPRVPQTALHRLRGPARVKDWLSEQDVNRLRRALLDGDVDLLEEYGSALGKYGVMLTPADQRHTLSLRVVLEEVACRRQSAARDAHAEGMGWDRRTAEAAFAPGAG